MSVRKKHLLILMLCTCLGACMKQSYQAQPLEPELLAQHFYQRSLDSDSLRQFMTENAYRLQQWPLQSWDNNALILAALHYHPDLLLARARYALARAAEISAGQKPNPGLGMTPEIHSDEGNSGSPISFGFLLDWPLERSAKRQARIDAASAQSDAQHTEIRQTAWVLRDQVSRQYIEYLDASGRKRLLLQSEGLLQENMKLLQRRVELGESGGFELSSQRLELQRLQLQILKHETRIAASFSALAVSIGLPLSALENIEISSEGAELLPAEDQIDVGALQRQALQGREDILAALHRYAASEARLREAVEKQQPDVNLSPGYLFDQGDNVWSLGISWLLPLFHSHEGAIAEASAQRDLDAAEFIALQMRVINKLQSSYQAYCHALRAWQSARQLEADLGQRLLQMERQFELGYSTRLELNRQRLELYEAGLSLHDFKFNALRALAELEDSAQHSLRSQQQLWNPQLLTDQQP